MVGYLGFKMTLIELEIEFEKLGNYKTKDVDKLNKRLIKEKVDVSFLKDSVSVRQEFYRTYFQVSLASIKNVSDQFKFIEDNFNLLNDWWHVDILPQFLKEFDLDFAYAKACEYIKHENPFVRRWGYVLFMPSIVKEELAFEKIVSILKNDSEYYVIMAEAWLISYLAIYHFDKTYDFIKNDNDLSYDIIGRAIQKTCDSFRVSSVNKEKIKKLRMKYKK